MHHQSAMVEAGDFAPVVAHVGFTGNSLIARATADQNWAILTGLAIQPLPKVQMDRFYADIKPFRDFDDFADLGAYVPVPDDWFVMLTDVQGSTLAIESGRYKDVNMVGAASITAVLNVCGDVEVPFGFGGDGGVVIVPPDLRSAASLALVALQNVSQDIFGLPLRAGAIPVADLRARGADLGVRKYQMSPGNYLAMFSGGGMTLADDLLKDPSPDNRYVFAPDTASDPPDLAGLSCRWQPLVPKGGRMLAILIKEVDPAARARENLLRDLVQGFEKILDGGPREAAPASRYSMRFKWPPAGLSLEARTLTGGTHGTFGQQVRIYAESFVQLICERLRTRIGPYDAPRYGEELRANTDFRRYDGMFRLLLDVTPDQAGQIEAFLAGQHRDGRLVYGVHSADTALMTCLVFSLEKSEHVHFVDGADGGFAFAARQLKKQMAPDS